MLNWALNIAITVTGVGVFVGWIRHRTANDYRDIHKSEISEDLTAGDELLEDALVERRLMNESRRG